MKSIRSKLMMAITAVTVVTAIVVGWQAYGISRDALEKASFDQLVAVRELKADQVDSFFRTIRNQVIALSADRMVTDAMQSFSDAFADASASDRIVNDARSVSSKSNTTTSCLHRNNLPR